MQRADMRQVQGVTLEHTAFRACSPNDTDFHQTAEANRRDPGRFNTESVGAVYFSLEAETAIQELQRTAEREGKSLSAAHPCSLFVVRVRVQRLVDLTTPDELARWGLTEAALLDDDMQRCRAAAAAIAQAGAEGVLWPSATGEGRSLAVFASRLAPSSGMKIVRTHELTCDMLRAIERGESPARVLAEVSA